MPHTLEDDSRSIDISQLQDLIGKEIGVSDWHLMDQRRIDAFADATEDWQFIHVDPERAHAALSLGGTIAHGFLSLSLLSVMAAEAVPPIRGMSIGMNYGFDKVRFLAPVPSGSQLRAHFVTNSIEPQGKGQFRICYGVSMEIAGAAKPALVADWIVLIQIIN